MRLFELLKILTGDAKIINQYGTELFRIENNRVYISDVMNYGNFFVSEIEMYEGIFRITIRIQYDDESRVRYADEFKEN